MKTAYDIIIRPIITEQFPSSTSGKVFVGTPARVSYVGTRSAIGTVSGAASLKPAIG